jgi:hypothetical protein
MTHPADSTSVGVVIMNLASGKHVGVGWPILDLFGQHPNVPMPYCHLDSGGPAQNLAVEFDDDGVWGVYDKMWILYKNKRQRAVEHTWSSPNRGTDADPWGMTGTTTANIKYLADGEGNLYAIGPVTGSGLSLSRKIRVMDISGTTSLATITWDDTPFPTNYPGTAATKQTLALSVAFPQDSGILFLTTLDYTGAGNILSGVSVVDPALSLSHVRTNTTKNYEWLNTTAVLPQPSGAIVNAADPSGPDRIVRVNTDGTFAADVAESSWPADGATSLAHKLGVSPIGANSWLTTDNHWIIRPGFAGDTGDPVYKIKLSDLTDVTPAWMLTAYLDGSPDGSIFMISSPDGDRLAFLRSDQSLPKNQWVVYDADGDEIMIAEGDGGSPQWPWDDVQLGTEGRWQHCSNNCVATWSEVWKSGTRGLCKLSLDSVLTAHELTETRVPGAGSATGIERDILCRGQYANLSYAAWH